MSGEGRFAWERSTEIFDEDQSCGDQLTEYQCSVLLAFPNDCLARVLAEVNPGALTHVIADLCLKCETSQSVENLAKLDDALTGFYGNKICVEEGAAAAANPAVGATTEDLEGDKDLSTPAVHCFEELGAKFLRLRQNGCR